MIKKLWNVFVQTLALNFLLLAGAVGWLYQSGRLDKPRAAAIREIVFPTSQPSAPTTEPSEPTTRPLLRLEALLEKHAGRPAGEQVEVIQQTFDTQSALLDRRRREIDDLQAQVAAEQKRLAEASGALGADRKQLAEQRQQTEQAAADKGFDDTLKLYSAMPPKQVKAVFMGLPENEAARYLQAMAPRTATKIVKEFKGPQELARANRILEQMRHGPAGSQATTQPAGEAEAAASGP